MFVIPKEPKVVGLLTRKDVCKEHAQLVLGEKANTGLLGNAEGAFDMISILVDFENRCVEKEANGIASISANGCPSQ